MKRGLTILTAALFASALALPVMAQSTDTGSTKEAPAASAATNPNPMGSDKAAQPSSEDSSAKAGSEAMKPEQNASDAAAAQPQSGTDKSDANTASDSGSAAEGHQAE